MQGLLSRKINRSCVINSTHIVNEHNFGTKFLEGWVYVTPHILALDNYNFDFSHYNNSLRSNYLDSMKPI
jgi:hypothetical protein